MAVLEERIAALEGGLGAVATASGQAALHLAVVTLMGQGTHRVVGLDLRRNHNMFYHTLPRFGITATFVDPRDRCLCQGDYARHAADFRETLGNPGLEVMDLPRIAEVAPMHVSR